MALLFADSFDHYTSTAQKWDTSNSSIGAFGRFGTNGYQDGAGSLLVKTLPGGSKGTLILGAAVFRANATAGRIFSFRDAGSQQCELRFNSSGQLRIDRAGTPLATGTTVVGLSQFTYLEFKVTFDNSAGVAIARINGVVELNLTSQDTQNTANATANQIVLGDDAVNLFGQFDDLVCMDTVDSGISGAPNNNFLGDVRVESIFPSGNGNTSQLVGQDANSTDNYLNVDETPPDSDTTYNESSTVNDKDTYAYGNVTPTTGAVYGVHVLPFARKTDAGTRTIKSIARLAGTEVDSADKTLNSTYAYLPDIREADPAGVQWTISNVNSSEFGVKVTA